MDSPCPAAYGEESSAEYDASDEGGEALSHVQRDKPAGQGSELTIVITVICKLIVSDQQQFLVPMLSLLACENCVSHMSVV